MDLKLQEHIWVGHMGYPHAGSSEIIGCLQDIWFEKKTEIKQKLPLAFILIFRGSAERKSQKRREWERIVKAENNKRKPAFP